MAGMDSQCCPVTVQDGPSSQMVSGWCLVRGEAGAFGRGNSPAWSVPCGTHLGVHLKKLSFISL